MDKYLEAAHTLANCLTQSAENGMIDRDEYLKARETLKSGVSQNRLPTILKVSPSGEAVDAYLRRIATGDGSWSKRRNAYSKMFVSR